jgi:hypothetical protein
MRFPSAVRKCEIDECFPLGFTAATTGIADPDGFYDRV